MGLLSSDPNYPRWAVKVHTTSVLPTCMMTISQKKRRRSRPPQPSGHKMEPAVEGPTYKQTKHGTFYYSYGYKKEALIRVPSSDPYGPYTWQRTKDRVDFLWNRNRVVHVTATSGASNMVLENRAASGAHWIVWLGYLVKIPHLGD